MHIAIVLKKHLHKQKISLLGNMLGRVDAIYNQNILISTGALISFEYTTINNRTSLSSITLLDLPLYMAQQDILFVHHVFELITYLLPIGMNDKTIFDLCLHLFKKQNLSALEKKTFLCLLFYISGFIPFGIHKKIMQLSTHPIDMIRKESLHLADEYIIDEWLKACVQEHFTINGFKTRQFLHIHNLI